jgi:hypothetical protein
MSASQPNLRGAGPGPGRLPAKSTIRVTAATFRFAGVETVTEGGDR